jgi:endonuclease YncB( thermonuclease family)
MILLRLLCLLCLLAAVPESAWAADAKDTVAARPRKPDDLDLIDLGKVVEVTRSDAIKLENGKVYRLAHIRVPAFYEAQATEALRAIVMGRTVGIYADKKEKDPEKDRYGNRYVNVLRDDARWVQADLVAQGLSWASSTERNRILVPSLYPLEAAAQRMKLGFWANPEFMPQPTAKMQKFLNTYQMHRCEIGRVISYWERVVFICGMDLSKPVTMIFSIPAEKKKYFVNRYAERGYFEGWRSGAVIVRGWVEKDVTFVPSTMIANIIVTHPEQLDFINPETNESTMKR